MQRDEQIFELIQAEKRTPTKWYRTNCLRKLCQ